MALGSSKRWVSRERLGPSLGLGLGASQCSACQASLPRASRSASSGSGEAPVLARSPTRAQSPRADDACSPYCIDHLPLGPLTPASQSACTLRERRGGPRPVHKSLRGPVPAVHVHRPLASGDKAQSLRLRRAPVIVGKMPPERGSRAGPSQLAARRGHGHARLGSPRRVKGVSRDGESHAR